MSKSKYVTAKIGDETWTVSRSLLEFLFDDPKDAPPNATPLESHRMEWLDLNEDKDEKNRKNN